MRIQQILNVSDENDRQNFGLYGIRETMKGDFGKSNHGVNTNSMLMNRKFRDTSNNFSNFLNISNESKTLPQIHINKNRISTVSCNFRHKYKNYNNSSRDNNVPGYKEGPKEKENMNIEVDNNCLSCTGNNTMITQAFKLACLNYSSSVIF